MNPQGTQGLIYDTLIAPGDLVCLNPHMWANRQGDMVLTLWKNVSRTLEELHATDNTASCDSIAIGDVCLVVARVSSLNGIAGTETDHLCLLARGTFGWNTAHWFQKIQD